MDKASEKPFNWAYLSRQSYLGLMPESLEPLSDRACRMTNAHNTGIEITEKLRAGGSLLSTVADSSIQTEYLTDSYPEWYPAPHSFLGMFRLLIHREATSESYRALGRYQENGLRTGADCGSTCRDHRLRVDPA